MGNRVLKLMVVVLSTINALVWWLYTESNLMALIWAAVAVAFVYWIIDDTRREWAPRKLRAPRRALTPRVRMAMTRLSATTQTGI